jgi:hypothetical protein
MSNKNEYEKTMIEAGVLLITLLFIIVQLPNLPQVRPLGDLFSAAFAFILGVLVASLLMFYSMYGGADSIMHTGRVVVFVSFLSGLSLLAVDFYQLAEALGTKTDLASLLVELAIIAILVFLISSVHQRREKAKSS